MLPPADKCYSHYGINIIMIVPAAVNKLFLPAFGQLISPLATSNLLHNILLDDYLLNELDAPQQQSELTKFQIVARTLQHDDITLSYTYAQQMRQRCHSSSVAEK